MAFTTQPDVSGGWMVWEINPNAAMMGGTRSLIMFKHSNDIVLVQMNNSPDEISKFGGNSLQSELDGVVVHSGNEEILRCEKEEKTMPASFCYSQGALDGISMNPDMGMESELKPAPRMGDPGTKRASFTTRIKSEMKRISTIRGNKEPVNGSSVDGSTSNSKANRRIKFDRTVSSAERGLKSLRFLDRNVGGKENDAAWKTVDKRFEQFAVNGRVSRENFGACIGVFSPR
jgi:hypothetical protein